MDRRVVDPVRSQCLDVGEPDLRRRQRQLDRVVAERPQARLEPGVPVAVLRMLRQLVWCALGTEVVRVGAPSVVALVGSGDDSREELALLP
jgi:hypothetical protein